MLSIAFALQRSCTQTCKGYIRDWLDVHPEPISSPAYPYD